MRCCTFTTIFFLLLLLLFFRCRTCGSSYTGRRRSSKVDVGRTVHAADDFETGEATAPLWAFNDLFLLEEVVR